MPKRNALQASSGFTFSVHADRRAMGMAAAEEVAAEIRTRLARQSHLRMIFAAAPSQTEMLAGLVAAKDIDWPRIEAFHMDEYIGLPANAEQRFGLWLNRHLFDHVPFGVVHRMEPEPDPAREAARYAALLARAPIDIVCLGIGVNGHIAFNDPPVADFDDPQAVKIVELDVTCRRQQVEDGCFARFADVPTHALTLTIPRLLAADKLFCAVPGPMKRAAVTRTLRGPIDTLCPASVLRTHPACRLFLDRDSAPPDVSLGS